MATPPFPDLSLTRITQLKPESETENPGKGQRACVRRSLMTKGRFFPSSLANKPVFLLL